MNTLSERVFLRGSLLQYVWKADFINIKKYEFTKEFKTSCMSLFDVLQILHLALHLLQSIVGHVQHLLMTVAAALVRLSGGHLG